DRPVACACCGAGGSLCRECVGPRKKRRLLQSVSGAAEKSQNVLFAGPGPGQQAIAVQGHIAAAELALWLGKLLFPGEPVEPAPDFGELLPSRRQPPRESIASRLASDVLGVAEKLPQDVFALPVLVAGDRS